MIDIDGNMVHPFLGCGLEHAVFSRNIEGRALVFRLWSSELQGSLSFLRELVCFCIFTHTEPQDLGHSVLVKEQSCDHPGQLGSTLVLFCQTGKERLPFFVGLLGLCGLPSGCLPGSRQSTAHTGSRASRLQPQDTLGI